MPVLFHREGSAFRVFKKNEMISWIEDSVRKERHIPGDINIILCTDKFLLKLNREYLNHDTFTDIITFDYCTAPKGKKIINGDIYISTDRIRENAARFGQPITQEFRRVVIHGVLHLCGYKDKKPADKKLMTAKEDLYLSRFPR